MSIATSVAARSALLDKRAGMLAMIVAMALLPLGDSISKSLTAVATPMQVTIWRSLAQVAFFIPVAFVFRAQLRGPVLTPMSLMSALMILTVTLSLVTAFEAMPIATAIAIFFVEPLLLTLLAGLFLGEVPGPRRYAAVAVGLIGALIVIRPNLAAFGPVALLPLLAALAYALNMIIMRKATRRQSALGFQFGASLFAGVIVLIVQGARWALLPGAAPSVLPGWVLLMVIGAGALAMMSFLLITFAFSRVEASLLAPFQYLEIVGAIAVGFVIFGEMPDGMTLLGAAIILASGAYVFHRERQNNVEAATADAARDR
ncbi:DMT family transporter [Profundibacterium mesophilum]|uniref:Permease n=1 Tax=Profundibacterium mesophilum KAUST100406-0324 TaxID=1037889 RepID=A0A921TB16_9RHOB|nr:DMT family transporter [Profundibacterium mesophilum]KAF0674610.1 Permease [Profundibacterium mesophilum KAUST100406-0324]